MRRLPFIDYSGILTVFRILHWYLEVYPLEDNGVPLSALSAGVYTGWVAVLE